MYRSYQIRGIHSTGGIVFLPFVALLVMCNSEGKEQILPPRPVWCIRLQLKSVPLELPGLTVSVPTPSWSAGESWVAHLVDGLITVCDARLRSIVVRMHSLSSALELR